MLMEDKKEDIKWIFEEKMNHNLSFSDFFFQDRSNKLEN